MHRAVQRRRALDAAIWLAMSLLGFPRVGKAEDREVLEPVPFTAVKLDDCFWSPRIATTLARTLPHVFDRCEATGRIQNWERAANDEGTFEGYFFNDSDVYKAIEAASVALALNPDLKRSESSEVLLRDYVDDLIARIAAMQQPDGYVNSYFTLHREEPRWTDIENKHELYCAGHLIEAAVAHRMHTRKSNFLEIAIRLADHIDATFGPGKNMNPCGHPEIELALLKLADLLDPESASEAAAAPGAADGARRYRDLARFFIERHGRPEGRAKLWGEYAQDHKPLVEQTEIAGHAVRAMYLYSAATDIARQTGEASYIRSLDAIWRDLTERKMYVTGGIGPSARNEGFTTAFDLPNETAYAETCASIGLVYWAHRMNLLHADGRYVDVLERALYNHVLAGISLDGTRFNYVNPLADRGRHERQPWFACACCPPNLARLLPTVGGYMYAQSDDAVYVNLYAQSTANLRRGARTLTLRQETEYPWGPWVFLTLSVELPEFFELRLRAPAWCRESKVWVVDKKFDNASNHRIYISNNPPDAVVDENGYLTLCREWSATATVFLQLPMTVERVYADSRVESCRGRVALQRGPILCAIEREHHDYVADAWRVVLPRSAKFEAASEWQRFNPNSLYAPLEVYDGLSTLYGPIELGKSWGSGARMIPYYAWGNGKPSDMMVWIPETPSILPSAPTAWLRPGALYCWKADTVWALNDRLEPTSSSDASIPRFTWWPRKGTVETVGYGLALPEGKRVRAVEVYWFSDARTGGGCKPPGSWKLLYQDTSGPEAHSFHGIREREVAVHGPYGVEEDRYNRVEFDPVETSAIEIEAVLEGGFSAGILEWKVETD